MPRSEIEPVRDLASLHAGVGVLLSADREDRLDTGRRRSDALRDGLSVASVDVRFTGSLACTAGFSPGRWIVLSLRGTSETHVQGLGRLDLPEGGWTLLAQGRDFETRTRLDAPSHFKAVKIALPDDWLASVCAEDEAELAECLHLGVDRARGESGIMNPSLSLLARQLFGPAREFTLGLELEARVLDVIAALVRVRRQGNTKPLRPGDIARLHAARDILINDVRSPPGLLALARSVGMSATRLKVGFKSRFGCSIGAFVETQRFDLAVTLLRAGELRMAEVAYFVGYTPSAFAAAFRRRYGVAPRDFCSVRR